MKWGMLVKQDRNVEKWYFGDKMADGHNVPHTGKTKRRISSIPTTLGRYNSNPVKKKAKGQGKEVEINAVEVL